MVTWTNGDELSEKTNGDERTTWPRPTCRKNAVRCHGHSTSDARQTNGRNVIGSGREDDAPCPPPRRPWREHWRAAFRARGDGSMDGWMCYCLLLGSARRPLHLHLQAPKALFQSPLILLLLIQSARLINNLGEAGRTSLSSASSSFLPSPGSTIQPPSHQLAEARPSAPTPTPTPSVPPPSSCPQVRPPPPLTGSKKNSRGVRSPSQQ